MDTLQIGPLEVIAGDSFAVQLTILDKPRTQGGVPQDVTGWLFTAQWRRTTGSADAIPFTVDQTDRVHGIVILSLTPDLTRAMGGSGVFDVQGVDGPTVRTFVRGTTTYRPDITRA